MIKANRHVVILGAGPAGLTAGYLLAKRGVQVTVLEADPELVGGIARTVCYKGVRFDIGGHRFFTRNAEVQRLWSEILPNDMLQRRRLSRIHYRGKFYSYPIKPFEALVKLGTFESFRCLFSYLRRCLFPKANPVSFEDWVSNEFGSRLFEVFFRNYTEKVWGVPCSEISADWAAQRIKRMSLTAVVMNTLKFRTGADTVKSLLRNFHYPRLGPGMMWERCAKLIAEQGSVVLVDRRVTNLHYERSGAQWAIESKSRNGDVQQFEATDLISSVPINELVGMLEPGISSRSLAAANALRYRDFLTVILILKDRCPFNDQWLYIHDPELKVGRIQNFKAWSPDLVPDENLACLGLEYFCSRSEAFWTMTDDALIRLALRELVSLNLANQEDFVDGCVVRQPKAYPFYDLGYRANLDLVLRELEQMFPSLHLVGRNGRHRYNNQDHSMVTAMLSVENILAGARVHDLSSVNEDAEYHEKGIFREPLESTE